MYHPGGRSRTAGRLFLPYGGNTKGRTRRFTPACRSGKSLRRLPARDVRFDGGLPHCAGDRDAVVAVADVILLAHLDQFHQRQGLTAQQRPGHARPAFGAVGAQGVKLAVEAVGFVQRADNPVQRDGLRPQVVPVHDPGRYLGQHMQPARTASDRCQRPLHAAGQQRALKHLSCRRHNSVCAAHLLGPDILKRHWCIHTSPPFVLTFSLYPQGVSPPCQPASQKASQIAVL
ncbi:MAG: hypothetical protein DWB42_20220 [Chloroflexi bacterium]|nr:hypothetical protein [Chloroflexota bacterium]MDL1882251.1 hypothetical protein [Anaerolineae bacterium CFX8]